MGSLSWSRREGGGPIKPWPPKTSVLSELPCLSQGLERRGPGTAVPVSQVCESIPTPVFRPVQKFGLH